MRDLKDRVVNFQIKLAQLECKTALEFMPDNHPGGRVENDRRWPAGTIDHDAVSLKRSIGSELFKLCRLLFVE